MNPDSVSAQVPDIADEFRVHLFGRDSTIRPGWVTIGHELTNSNFNAELYASYFNEGRESTGCTERIEALRPKSPPNTSKGQRPRGRGGFRGRGRGRGAI